MQNFSPWELCQRADSQCSGRICITRKYLFFSRHSLLLIFGGLQLYFGSYANHLSLRFVCENSLLDFIPCHQIYPAQATTENKIWTNYGVYYCTHLCQWCLVCNHFLFIYPGHCLSSFLSSFFVISIFIKGIIFSIQGECFQQKEWTRRTLMKKYLG